MDIFLPFDDLAQVVRINNKTALFISRSGRVYASTIGLPRAEKVAICLHNSKNRPVAVLLNAEGVDSWEFDLPIEDTYTTRKNDSNAERLQNKRIKKKQREKKEINQGCEKPRDAEKESSKP